MCLPKFLKQTKRRLKLKGVRSAVASATAPATRDLVFTQQRQEQREWCWAAVTVSVLIFFHPEVMATQCGLANAELGRGDCCWNGKDPACNQPRALESPLSKARVLNGLPRPVVPFAAVVSEIDGGRPLAYRIVWPSGGGHAVVVHGYSHGASGIWVRVADPFFQSGTYLYNVFCTNYLGQGRCSHSFFTKP